MKSSSVAAVRVGLWRASYGSLSSLIIDRRVDRSTHLPVTSRWGCHVHMYSANVQKSVSGVGKPEGWSFSVVQMSHWLSTAALAASRLERGVSLRMTIL